MLSIIDHLRSTSIFCQKAHQCWLSKQNISFCFSEGVWLFRKHFSNTLFSVVTLHVWRFLLCNTADDVNLFTRFASDVFVIIARLLKTIMTWGAFAGSMSLILLRKKWMRLLRTHVKHVDSRVMKSVTMAIALIMDVSIHYLLMKAGNKLWYWRQVVRSDCWGKVSGHCMRIKGTISNSLGLRKIFKPFRNKERYLSITTCTIFPQKSHKFDRKTACYQISFITHPYLGCGT